jgi:uncharacterized protein (TIGR03086 family)
MDAVSNCRRATADALDIITAVDDAAWSAATPCEGWDARALVNHMIGVCTTFVGGLRTPTADATPEPVDLGSGDAATVYERAAGALNQNTSMGFSDAQLPETYRRATAALVAEWEAPGALEKTLHMPFGQMPGAVAIRIVTADSLVHTWDLSKALRRSFAMPEEVAASTLEMMQQFYNPDQRGPGKAFAHAIPCPETAPVQDRLIALSGRQP